MIDQYSAAQALLKAIAAKHSDRKIRLMEVCGTHTMAIFRSGIRQLLPDWLEIVSGPGCPVCVTPNTFIDQAIAYAKRPDVIITTFGDMMRVPGTESSLSQQHSLGCDIRIVYSPLDSLKIAESNPSRQVIFLGVGFETTVPAVAATILAAKAANIRNFFVLSAHKVVPPALKFLLANKNTNIAGFLLPGHVCMVTGTADFQFIADKYNTPAVVAGFEPLQILTAIYHLVEQITAGTPQLINDYREAVQAAGNLDAKRIMEKVYQPADALWRGLGLLKASGLELNSSYQDFAAEKNIPIAAVKTIEPKLCRCGDILQGLANPVDCPLFGKKCTPQNPVGSCMVSTEGTCSAWYKYGGMRFRNYGSR